MSESVDNGGNDTATEEAAAAAETEEETTDRSDRLPTPTPESVATFLRDLLDGIIQRMGLEATVGVSEDPETILLEVSGTSADELTAGRRGSVLDAMQYYLGKVLGHHGLRGKRVLIDAGGYRETRRTMLRVIANELADKVRKNGRALAVEPMSAYDRRIIHLACADMEGVVTRSEGEGEERRLLVLPASAAEEERKVAEEKKAAAQKRAAEKKAAAEEADAEANEEADDEPGDDATDETDETDEPEEG